MTFTTATKFVKMPKQSKRQKANNHIWFTGALDLN
jgi:hypothetical protein